VLGSGIAPSELSAATAAHRVGALNDHPERDNQRCHLRRRKEMQPHRRRNDSKGKACEPGDKRCRERGGDKQNQINGEKVTPISSAAIGVAAA
jgi:hypothetical protein